MHSILIQLCELVLLFFVFSVLGWCMEVFLKYLQYHRFINRGFLIGPYCPIYGAGVVFITVMVGLLAGVESSVGTTFTISFLGCGALEYAVSYYLEKRFHARWWDYSQKPMNLHGRIWIGNLLLFGLGGTVITEVLDPIVLGLFDRLPTAALYGLTVLVVVEMSADYAVSHVVMQFVKTSVEHSEADSTERVSQEIRLLLRDKSVLHRRIADAYPDVIYRTDRIKARMQRIRGEMERLQRESAESWERLQKEGAESWERLQQETAYGLELLKTTPTELRDEIIADQTRLITLLLQDGDRDTARQLALDIQAKKQRLEDRKNLYRRVGRMGPEGKSDPKGASL